MKAGQLKYLKRDAAMCLYDPLDGADAYDMEKRRELLDFEYAEKICSASGFFEFAFYIVDFIPATREVVALSDGDSYYIRNLGRGDFVIIKIGFADPFSAALSAGADTLGGIVKIIKRGMR